MLLFEYERITLKFLGVRHDVKIVIREEEWHFCSRHIQGQLSDVTDAYLVPYTEQRCITQNETLMIPFICIFNIDLWGTSQWTTVNIAVNGHLIVFVYYLTTFYIHYFYISTLWFGVWRVAWKWRPQVPLKNCCLDGKLSGVLCDSGCFSLLEQIFSVNLKREKRKTLYNGAIFVCIFAY